MKNLTEVVFILDRSGSMEGLEDDTIGGFNSMLEKQKKVEGDVIISTVLFDHETEVIHDRVPLADVKKLTREEYWTRGSTALLDAIGSSIKHIKKIHKYAREEDTPDKTLFVITTDGMENSSHLFDYNEIKKLVEAQKELGWEFIFLGANIDAIGTASHLGINADRAVNYHSDRIGTRKIFGGVSDFVSCFAAMPSENFADSMLDDSWRKAIDEDFKKRK